jgi:hypothetical protein
MGASAGALVQNARKGRIEAEAQTETERGDATKTEIGAEASKRNIEKARESKGEAEAAAGSEIGKDTPLQRTGLAQARGMVMGIAIAMGMQIGEKRIGLSAGEIERRTRTMHTVSGIESSGMETWSERLARLMRMGEGRMVTGTKGAPTTTSGTSSLTQRI